MSSSQRPPYEFIPEWASRVSVGASVAFVLLAILTLATDITPFESSVGTTFFSASVAVLFAGATYGAFRWLATYGLSSGVAQFTTGAIREAIGLTVPLVALAGVLGVITSATSLTVVITLFPLVSAVVLMSIPAFVRFQAWRASLDDEDEDEPLDRL